MKFYQSMVLSTVVGVAYASLSFAGAISGGGGDMKGPDFGAAWFLEEARTIRACVEVSPGFGASDDEARRAIHRAAQLWSDYFRDKKVNESIREASLRFQASSARTAAANPNGPRPGPTARADITVAYRLELLPTCNQPTGQPPVDLTFYLGNSSNPEVVAAKQSYEHPIAFAHRTAYDRQRGWGRGFIWVASAEELEAIGGLTFSIRSYREATGRSLYGAPYILSGILAHELGHVLGVDHFDGTIMDERLAVRVIRAIHSLRVANPQTTAAELLDRIDNAIELYACHSEGCAVSYVGAPVVRGSQGNTGRSLRSPETTFRLLTGRNSQGQIRVELRSPTVSGSPLNIMMTDDRGSVSLPIGVVANSTDWSAFSVNRLAFKTHRESSVGADGAQLQGGGWSTRGAQGGVGFTTLRSATGRRFRLVVEFNSVSGSGPVRVRYFDGDHLHELLNMGRVEHLY